MLRMGVIAGLLLCCALPGCLLVEVVVRWRRGISLFTRLGLGVGFSIVYTVVAGLILATFHALTRSAALVALAAPALALCVILAARWRRQRRAAHVDSASAAQTRSNRAAQGRSNSVAQTRSNDFSRFLRQHGAQTLHLLVLLAVVAGPRLYVASASEFVPLKPDSWFYMTDSLRLIDSQGIPSEITQWGMHTVFPPDKISFQMFTAMLMLVTQADFAEAFTLVTSIALCVAAVALWRFAAELVSLKIATLLTIVLFFDARFGAGFYSNRFGESFYRSESFAVMLGFLALWLTYRGLMQRQWLLLAFAPLGLALAATGHGISAFVAATIIGSIFLAKWIVRRRTDARELAALGLIAGLSLAGTVLIFCAARGAPLYQQSVMDPQAFQSDDATDPTFALRALLTDDPHEEYMLTRSKSVQRFYISPAALGQGLVQAAFPSPFWGGAGIVPLLAFCLMLGVAVWLPKTAERYRIAGVCFALVFAGVYLLGLAFSLRYETYAPAMHPSRRVFPYLSLGVLIWGGVILQRALDLIGAGLRRRRRWSVVGQSALYGGAGLVMLLSFVGPGVQSILRAPAHSDISGDGIAALTWLRTHTEPDALVLADHRTAGAFEIIAQRMCLTEGRAAYVRPDLVQRVMEILEQTAVFYRNPLFSRVVEEAGVDYVVVAPAADIGATIGYSPESQFSLALCEAAPFLSRVAQFGEVHIFKVDAAALGERAAMRLLEIQPADATPELEEIVRRWSAVADAPATSPVESPTFGEQLRAGDVAWIAVDSARSAAMKRSLERLPLTYPKVWDDGDVAVFLVNLAEGGPLADIGQAQLALAQGDLVEACRLFRAALAGAAGSPLALAGSGLCQDAQGERATARQSYEQALERLADSSWVAPAPAGLEAWRHRPDLFEQAWTATLRQGTVEFLTTRLDDLARAAGDDEPRAVWIEPQERGAAGAGHWESVLVNAWPQAIFVQPVGQSSSLSLGLRPGEAFFARLAAAGPDDALVTADIWAETAAGARRLFSARLSAGTDRTLQGTIPPDGSGQLTLASQGNALDTLTWQTCRTPCLAGETTARQVQGLAGWLTPRLRKQADGHAPSAAAVKALAAALLDGTAPAMAGLESSNLLKNFEFDAGSLAGWDAVLATGGAQVSAQLLSDSPTDWSAGSSSQEAGYHGGLCQVVAVEAGQKYVYVAQIAADLPAESKAIVGYVDRQRFGSVEQLNGRNLTKSAAWMIYWRLIVAPAFTKSVAVCPALLNGPGSVHFDRAWFIPLDGLAAAVR